MTDRIRLLVTNCEFPPLGGGAATATRELLRELESFPVDTDFVTASPSDRHEIVDFHSRCRIHFLPVGKKDIHYWTNRELLTYALGSFNYARSLHRTRPFDLAHAFFTLPAGAVAWRLRRLCPYLVSLRGSDVPGFSGRYKTAYRFLRPLTRSIWNRAAAVVANSPALASLALETQPRLDIGVIPNGIDTREFHPPAWRAEATTLLSVARLVPRKDIDTSIRATAQLAARFPDIRLIIAGDGPLAGRLEELAARLQIARRVEFKRYVPRQEIASVYREADVFLLTSRREGMSNTVLEALASGLPVVASHEALAGIDLPDAAVVPSGDATEVAQAVAHLLENADARRCAAEKSRQAALKYTWRAMAEKYFELYRQILARSGREERR